jgi:hypothetical protein
MQVDCEQTADCLEPFGIVRRAAQTAKVNGRDPEAYLRHVIARIADHP